ncbi:MAG: type IV pilus secretin PilQ [Acidobacteriota bacterium]|nr:type IV pilus secretin PilQ [Acidobacteriota bacterium]
MTRVQRILLIASMLILSAGAAPASWWKHRTPAKTAPQPAPAAASDMVLNAIELGSSATPQIILKTSGAPAFTSLSPTPDQFVVDLSGTSKAASIAMPSPLPPSISAITADEVTEMGNRLTRVTVHLTGQGTPQAAAEGNAVVVTLPAPAIAEAAPAPRITEAPAPIVMTPMEPAIKSEPVPSVKATVLKKIDTAGKGDAMEVLIATNGDASYSAFKLESPARVVIDLPGIKNKLTKNSIEVGDSLVKRVRGGQFKSDVARVVIELSQTTNFNIAKSGDRLHVTFGETAKAAANAPAPEVKIAEAPKAPEPAKSTDVVSQVPAIADNATWKLPQEASQGATAIIHAQDQAPPPAPRPRRTATPVSPTSPAPSTTENVFTEPAGPAVSPLAAGGARQLSAGEKVFTGEPISLNLKDADIKDVLRTFAQLTGLNIAVDPNVNGSVTVDFVDVPWDQALDLILRQNGLSYVLEGNVMRVGTLSRLSEEASANRRLQEEERLNVPLTTVSFKLSYARAQDVSTLLKEIASPRARLIVDQRTNQLIISEIPAYLQTMRNLIDSVDVPNRQVVIEARIVETTQSFLQQYGFNWGFRGTLDPSVGTGTGLVFPSRVDVVGGPFEFGAGNPVLSFSLGNVLGSFTLDVALNAAESESAARVIAAPRIQTQDNVPAQIQAGTQIPFQTRINFTTTVTYVDATLSLSVTPQITEAGTVIMDIQVQKNDPGPTSANAPGPSIATRRALTKLMVRDGGTAVIAGIYQTNESNLQNRLPFLYQIPVIGNLFKRHDINSTHQELLIFITPRIVRTS